MDEREQEIELEPADETASSAEPEAAEEEADTVHIEWAGFI